MPSVYCIPGWITRVNTESLWPLLPSTFQLPVQKDHQNHYIWWYTLKKEILCALWEREREIDSGGGYVLWVWVRVTFFAISCAAFSEVGLMSVAGYGDARDEHSDSLRLWHWHKHMYCVTVISEPILSVKYHFSCERNFSKNDTWCHAILISRFSQQQLKTSLYAYNA